MRRFQRGYSSYRGRRTLTDVLKFVAAVLGVLVVVLLVVIWFNRSGSGFPLKLPVVSQQDDTHSGSEDSQSGSQANPDSPDEGQQDPDVSGNQAEQENRMTALELPVSAVLDGSAAAQLDQAGANALVLTMKDEEGMLAWNSQQPLAQSCGVSAGDEDVQAQLLAWNQGEVYTVARVCCFRDNTVPYHRNSMALRASYGNWRDEKGLRWLNPANDEAQAYLAELCGELATMGFDEILLECAAFPAAGAVENITSQEEDQTQAVSGFLTRVEQAVAPYETRISLRVEAGTLDKTAPECGITASLLSELEGRIWVAPGEGADAQTLLAQAGVSGGGERLVEIVPDLSQDGALSQAKFVD